MIVTIAGREVAVDAEGSLQAPEQWTEEIGQEIAAGLGLSLSDKHWQVIRFMRGSLPPRRARVPHAAHKSGAQLYACKASVDMFGRARDDFIEELEGIITVGEFHGMAGGGQIIFT